MHVLGLIRENAFNVLPRENIFRIAADLYRSIGRRRRLLSSLAKFRRLAGVCKNLVETD